MIWKRTQAKAVENKPHNSPVTNRIPTQSSRFIRLERLPKNVALLKKTSFFYCLNCQEKEQAKKPSTFSPLNLCFMSRSRLCERETRERKDCRESAIWYSALADADETIQVTEQFDVWGYFLQQTLDESENTPSRFHRFNGSLRDFDTCVFYILVRV